MLKLYENIKKRRTELNISQQELAELVGYKGKSMISQVENGSVDLPESMIVKFAEALKCSPHYLMGWDELESFATPEEFEAHWNAIGGGRHPIDLTDDEYGFIIDVRALHDPTFYQRMKMYMDLFTKKGDDNA
jgi:transcriptional regulator with XRE-family HTH domain